jgi:hypothetical protein
MPQIAPCDLVDVEPLGGAWLDLGVGDEFAQLRLGLRAG